jgi:hypothetical protein
MALTATAPVLGDVDAGDGPRKPLAVVVGDQPAIRAAARIFLQLRVERGAHRQAAAIELVLAIELGELAPHFLGEVLGRIELAAGGCAG